MAITPSTIDLSRLERIRHNGHKITARCPACAEAGGDRTGVHLAIFPGGKFACAAWPGDTEHRRRIFALAGIAGERVRDPEAEREWRARRAIEHHEAAQRERLLAAVREKRRKIIARHTWPPEDVWEDSPQRIDSDSLARAPAHFLHALFDESATVWTGDVFHSGTRHADRWRTVGSWQHEVALGPMTAPAIWNPGTTSRTAGNVLAAPYTVLDFDGFDGRQPRTPSEIKKHCLDSLALVRWLREDMGWRLAAIIWTGSKSVHAWFHTPPPDVVRSLRTTADAFGIDAGLIGRPEHPCRLPGQRHQKTGKLSRVIWLDAL